MASPSFHAMEPSQLLHYLPTYRVLICLRCNYAIQPGAVARHLKEIHHLRHLSRRPFVDYASGFKLSQPSDAVLPDETQFPVPLLPVQNGLACSFAGCAHLCVTAKRMKQHWMSVHHISASELGDFWHPVPLQTFFRGNALRYFTNPALLISLSSDKSGGLANTVSRSIAIAIIALLIIPPDFGNPEFKRESRIESLPNVDHKRRRPTRPLSELHLQNPLMRPRDR
jgi:hypothetical protein